MLFYRTWIFSRISNSFQYIFWVEVNGGEKKMLFIFHFSRRYGICDTALRFGDAVYLPALN